MIQEEEEEESSRADEIDRRRRLLIATWRRRRRMAVGGNNNSLYRPPSTADGSYSFFLSFFLSLLPFLKDKSSTYRFVNDPLPPLPRGWG